MNQAAHKAAFVIIQHTGRTVSFPRRQRPGPASGFSRKMPVLIVTARAAYVMIVKRRYADGKLLLNGYMRFYNTSPAADNPSRSASGSRPEGDSTFEPRPLLSLCIKDGLK